MEKEREIGREGKRYYIETDYSVSTRKSRRDRNRRKKRDLKRKKEKEIFLNFFSTKLLDIEICLL